MSKFLFYGLLGNNCGTVSPYTGTSKRLQEVGFTISNGIPTLRGFAKISDLAAASAPQYEKYQRQLKEDHVDDIAKFLENCKDEAKFLPEVVLSVNDSKKAILKCYDHKGFASISETAKGAIKNIGYYCLEVEEETLTRVDGNHRLEAGKDKDFYIPFSIVLWNINAENPDSIVLEVSDEDNTESESFLFYILNNTARRLEAEENFKGLVKSKKWESDELVLINKHLPLLKHYYDKYDGNPLLNKQYFDSPLSQICEVLEEINSEDIDETQFDILLIDSCKLLDQAESFGYIKKEFSDIFFQLAFYSRYKNSDLTEACKMMGMIDKWLEKYKYTGEVFTKASKIYDVAYKHISVSPKYIFMAMQYKSEQIVSDYNGALQRAVTTLNNMGANVELVAHPIMTGEGKSINITADIYEKIENCSVFLADTTEANPNVMYELGIAFNKKKPIIMVREKGKQIKVPSDIISEYYYSFDGMTELENLFVKHIRTIMEKDYGIVYPG